MDERAADASISVVDIRGEQEGEHRGGNTPSARGVPPSRSAGSPESRSIGIRRVGQVLPRTSIRAESCGTGTSGGVLCRPTHRDTAGEVSIAVPWRERPPSWTAWPAKPAASKVVAHATLSVSQPERSSSDSCIEAALNACGSTSRSSAVAESLCGSQLARSRRCACPRFRSARAARG
jgi:hypothetical protein